MNTVVHAAIRRTFDRFDAALAVFPVGSGDRAAELKRAWDHFEHELHVHHTLEEEYFWPALAQTDADLSSVAALDEEHDAMRLALARATEGMAGLQAAPTVESLAVARLGFDELRRVLLDHLDHEERDLEPIAAAYHDSKPMRAALNRVKRRHLASMGSTVEWLQDGAGEEDRAGLRSQIPAPVVFLLGAVGGRRYRRRVAPTWVAAAR
jgi:hypothetical protein